MQAIEKVVRSRIRKELVRVSPAQPSSTSRKIVTISDLHPPFHNQAVIQHMLDNHGDADICVLNGDILDADAASKWAKSKEIAFDAEYKIVSEFVWQLANIFPKVIINSGNHDHRVTSKLMASVPHQLASLVKYDALDLIASGYTLDKYGDLVQSREMPNVKYTAGPTSWFCKIGRTIFAHPSNAGGVPMGIAVKAAEYFATRNLRFDCLVIGHSHSQGWVIRDGRLIIEQGCACYPLEYEAGAKLMYRHPSTFGYAVVYQNRNGLVDFNSSGPVFLGSGTMVRDEGHS